MISSFLHLFLFFLLTSTQCNFSSGVTSKDSIKLRSGDFPQISGIQKRASNNHLHDINGHSLWLVSLSGPPSTRIYKDICNSHFCEFIPPSHYLIRASKNRSQELTNSTFVRGVQPYHGHHKIDRQLYRHLQQNNVDWGTGMFLERHQKCLHAPVELLVMLGNRGKISQMYHTNFVTRLQDAINVTYLKASSNHFLRIGLANDHLLHDSIRWIADQPEVVWIEKKSTLKTFNAYQESIIQGGKGDILNRPIAQRKLRGKGQKVGLADTGLDWKHAYFRDTSGENNTTAIQPEFINLSTLSENDLLSFSPVNSTSKVYAYMYYDFSDQADQPGGHGTHVAGTLAGRTNDESSYLESFSGALPDAQIVFVDLNGDSAHPEAITAPDDLFASTFRPMSLFGADIQCHSWGNSADNYDVNAYFSDEYMETFENGLLVFAAGNDGTTYCCNKSGTISTPALAKNVIAVGATQSAPFPIIFFRNKKNDTIALENNKTFLYLNEATFGPPINSTVISGVLDIFWPDDVCQLQQDVTGKILIAKATDTCSPVKSSICAQNAGAEALIIVSNDKYVDFTEDEDPSDITMPVLHLVANDVENLLLELDNQDLIGNIQRIVSLPISDMAPYSSQGPTNDGRIKPDVVAPGDLVLSAHANNNSKYCKGKSLRFGTSMASPSVAGSAVLIREYFMKGYYPGGLPNVSNVLEPTGALLKAMLINSARRLSGVTYVNATDNEKNLTRVSLQQETYPYQYQGHGLIHLDNVLQFSDSNFSLYVDQQRLDNTRENMTYFVNVSAGSTLAATLVWTDPVSFLGASEPVVNSLSLCVRLPNDTLIWGNMNSDTTQDNIEYIQDYVNTAQKVIFEMNKDGILEISIIANHIVLGDTQSYALVLTGQNQVCLDRAQCTQALSDRTVVLR